MLAPLLPIMPAKAPLPQLPAPTVEEPSAKELETKETFQRFVAGTFYRELLKSFRKSQGEMAYLNGGQAEKLFQSQLDEELIEQLARSQGAALSGALYQNFALKQQHLPAKSSQPDEPAAPAQPAPEIPGKF